MFENTGKVYQNDMNVAICILHHVHSCVQHVEYKICLNQYNRYQYTCICICNMKLKVEENIV